MSVITSIMGVRPRLAGDLVDEHVDDFEDAVGDRDEQQHHDESPRNGFEVTKSKPLIAHSRGRAPAAQNMRDRSNCMASAPAAAHAFLSPCLLKAPLARAHRMCR